MTHFRHEQLNEKTVSGRVRIFPPEPLVPSGILATLDMRDQSKAIDDLKRIFFCFRLPSSADLLCMEILRDGLTQSHVTIDTEFISTPPRFDDSLYNVGGDHSRVSESADHQAMKQWVIDHLRSKQLEAVATEVAFLGFRIDVASLRTKTFVECGDTEPKKIFDFLIRSQPIGILQYECEEIVWFRPALSFPEFGRVRTKGYLA